MFLNNLAQILTCCNKMNFKLIDTCSISQCTEVYFILCDNRVYPPCMVVPPLKLVVPTEACRYHPKIRKNEIRKSENLKIRVVKIRKFENPSCENPKI